ncbi:MAG TPA: WD40 repeat domain-containing protein [Gemmataceae bacterium]|nr:WD40 repeat domain-containing protein [Gemmataceae bacterium]
MRITSIVVAGSLLTTLTEAGDEKRDVHTLKGHTKEVRALAFNADGTLLATGGNDQTVRLWDAASGKELETLKADD